VRGKAGEASFIPSVIGCWAGPLPVWAGLPPCSWTELRRKETIVRNAIDAGQPLGGEAWKGTRSLRNRGLWEASRPWWSSMGPRCRPAAGQ